MTTKQPAISRPPFRWFLYLVAWTILGIVVATFVSPRELMRELPRPMAAGIIELGVTLYALGFLLPLPVLVSHYAPLNRGRLLRVLAVHLLAMAVFALLHWWIVKLSMEWAFDLPRQGRGWRGRGMGPGPRPEMRFWFTAFHHFGAAIFGYWLVVGAWHAVDASRRLKQREVQASQLEAQLATARLQALEDQLQPHFLFNTLNTLSSLIYEDVEAADKVIRDLSTLLRLALDNAGSHTVPLEDEVRFVGVYLDIMQTRYPNRLEVTLDVDPAAAACAVPNLLLQPLVENSIKHGLEASDGAVRIELSARREHDRLHLEVTDNGPGLPDAPREGVGLRNTRARLRQLYGDEAGFEIGNRDGGGVRASVEIPARASEPRGDGA